MSNIISTIKALPKLLPLKPVSADAISEAEKELNLKFAEEYKTYVSEFGAILADGIELTGIAKSKSRNVVSVTIQERNLNARVPKNLYVIENIGIDGIIVWQDESGIVYKTSPNADPLKIAASLTGYIESKKLFV